MLRTETHELEKMDAQNECQIDAATGDKETVHNIVDVKIKFLVGDHGDKCANSAKRSSCHDRDQHDCKSARGSVSAAVKKACFPPVSDQYIRSEIASDLDYSQYYRHNSGTQYRDAHTISSIAGNCDDRGFELYTHHFYRTEDAERRKQETWSSITIHTFFNVTLVLSLLLMLFGSGWLLSDIVKEANGESTNEAVDSARISVFALLIFLIIITSSVLIFKIWLLRRKKSPEKLKSGDLLKLGESQENSQESEHADLELDVSQENAQKLETKDVAHEVKGEAVAHEAKDVEFGMSQENGQQSETEDDFHDEEPERMESEQDSSRSVHDIDAVEFARRVNRNMNDNAAETPHITSHNNIEKSLIEAAADHMSNDELLCADIQYDDHRSLTCQCKGVQVSIAVPALSSACVVAPMLEDLSKGEIGSSDFQSMSESGAEETRSEEDISSYHYSKKAYRSRKSKYPNYRKRYKCVDLTESNDSGDEGALQLVAVQRTNRKEGKTTHRKRVSQKELSRCTCSQCETDTDQRSDISSLIET